MTTLAAENLAKSYKTKVVVSDVSFRVSTGEIVGIMGANGAGKTTCFYMVVGLVPADEGRILLDQEDLTHQAMYARARRGIAYLPQEASVFRRLTVAQNIRAILETRKDLSEADGDNLLEELLEELHIHHIAQSKGMSLSGGERRRVEIARALALDPKFILLDEPFAGVDPISVLDIQKTIRHLRDRGIGVLITDHNVRETLEICQRAYIINEGKVLTSGSPEEVLNNEQVRAVYLGEKFKLNQ